MLLRLSQSKQRSETESRVPIYFSTIPALAKNNFCGKRIWHHIKDVCSSRKEPERAPTEYASWLNLYGNKCRFDEPIRHFTSALANFGEQCL
mmetsp:Transcript_13219/g.15442  ORF Transcript_13219/g.15442 Transcript_13219/m.15442 type:complete len:92 (-) Transcript_13219:847-1122(-)